MYPILSSGLTSFGLVAPTVPHATTSGASALPSPAPVDDEGASLRRAQLAMEARRRARRCRRAVLAVTRINRGGRIIRADVAERIERARTRAIGARVDYLKAIDRLWMADASEEAMTIFREQRSRPT